VIDPEYLDVTVPAGAEFTHPVAAEHTAFAYCIAGDGDFAHEAPIADRQVVLFADGDEVTVQAGAQGVRFLLVSGRPLHEPIAWHGPIVMNTSDELREAFRELKESTFVKVGG
jgi:redox-sensitive bicupin YhaK (pirin superfamily)